MPQSFATLNGIVFFAAEDGEHGMELWRTDGTEQGTMLIKDFDVSPQDSFPNNLITLNGVLYFVAHGHQRGQELWKRDLWKSDGTAAGTTMIDLPVPRSGTLYPDRLTVVSDHFFFAATPPSSDGRSRDCALWISDGTADGTHLVKDICPIQMTQVNGTLFFTADDPQYGMELWRSDGTEAGTVVVKDIFAGGLDSQPRELTVIDDTLFFVANDGIHGEELWKSDGTTAGTMLVKDIVP
jgi:ELWxxDGT repeat protein